MSFLSTVDNYPEFSSFSHPSKEEVFQYIDLMYNSESSLIQDYQDIAMRKKVAAVAAGLDPDQEWVKNILSGMDAEFNTLVQCYIGPVQNSYTFQMLCTAEELFSELNAIINEKVKKLSITDDKTVTMMKGKADLMNKLSDTRATILALRSELYDKKFGLDSDKPLVAKKRISPENV